MRIHRPAVRRAMKNLGLDAQAVSHRAHVPVSHVETLMSGRGSIPLVQLQAVADVLGKRVCDFVAEPVRKRFVLAGQGIGGQYPLAVAFREGTGKTVRPKIAVMGPPRSWWYWNRRGQENEQRQGT